MNLALRDVRRHVGRFVGTAAGLGLLLTVVVAMQGIYAGMVDDATILTRAMRADLWVVQRGTRGPFAEGSRLDPSIETRAAAVPGVRRARPYTYQLIQRERGAEVVRIALVGVGWPDDRGAALPIVRGRALGQAHGEIVVDASLGVAIGESLTLAGEPYRVVGLTRDALTSGGDSVAFLTVADAVLVAVDQPAEALVLERARVAERLRKTDLGRGQPALEDLATDPRWRAPSLAAPPVAAVLVDVDPRRTDEVLSVLQSWGDVAVYRQS
ncbi:MAG: ABC transporter permease, partial [Myxococcales bacterium]|nr:ABC transporter permease [Myxococcales bacterium]